MNKFLRKYVTGAWSFIAEIFLTIKYWDARKAASFQLCECKRKVSSITELIGYYGRLHLGYTENHLHIIHPAWITIAKGGGNGGDFAELSYEILSEKYGNIWRGVCYGKCGSHEVVVVCEDGKFVLLNGLNIVGIYGALEEAAKSIYGDETKDYWFF